MDTLEKTTESKQLTPDQYDTSFNCQTPDKYKFITNTVRQRNHDIKCNNGRYNWIYILLYVQILQYCAQRLQ